MRTASLALALSCALTLPGCFLYCPMYATSGCLERTDLDRLAQQGDHAALVAYLGDERSWVREEAARAIGEHRVVIGGDPLVARLADTGEKRYVRAAAARALADLGRTDVVPALEAIAERPEEDPELDLAVLDAMCRLAPHDSRTQSTLQRLTEDEDLLVASAARHRQRAGCGQ